MIHTGAFTCTQCGAETTVHHRACGGWDIGADGDLRCGPCLTLQPGGGTVKWTGDPMEDIRRAIDEGLREEGAGVTPSTIIVGVGQTKAEAWGLGPSAGWDAKTDATPIDDLQAYFDQLKADVTMDNKDRQAACDACGDGNVGVSWDGVGYTQAIPCPVCGEWHNPPAWEGLA